MKWKAATAKDTLFFQRDRYIYVASVGKKMECNLLVTVNWLLAPSFLPLTRRSFPKPKEGPKHFGGHVVMWWV